MQTVNRRVSCSLAEDADQRCMYACPPGLHELLQLWSSSMSPAVTLLPHCSGLTCGVHAAAGLGIETSRGGLT